MASSAALSGSHHKAPGFAGGYLLVLRGRHRGHPLERRVAGARNIQASFHLRRLALFSAPLASAHSRALDAVRLPDAHGDQGLEPKSRSREYRDDHDLLWNDRPTPAGRGHRRDIPGAKRIRRRSPRENPGAGRLTGRPRLKISGLRTMEVMGVAEGVAVAARPAFRDPPRIGESGVGARRSD